MRHIQRYTALLLTVFIALGAGSSTAAAQDREKIGRIVLDFQTDLEIGESGGDVSVTTSTDHVYIDSADIINQDDESWTTSRTPIIEVVLGVEDDSYYFSRSGKSAFRLNLQGRGYDEIQYRSSRREDSNRTMVLTVRLAQEDTPDEIPAPSGACWSSTDNSQGQWEASSYAKYYQVQLLKDGRPLSDPISSYNPYYDFSSQITQSGSYRFRVRSVGKDSNVKSLWSYSQSWDVYF